MTLVAYGFSKLPTVKGTITQMFKKHRVIAPFYGQHVKRCKTFVKFSWRYFYQISFSLWAKGTWENYFLLIFELLRVLHSIIVNIHSHYISDIIDCQRHGYTNVWIASFQSSLRQWTCQSVPKIYEIWMTALLSYFLLTVRKIYLGNSSIRDILTLRNLC